MSSVNLQPHHRSPTALAWQLSLPVLVSYFTIGIVFGALFTHLHVAWYWAPIMSAACYTGAAQLIATSLMATHASYLVIFLSTIFVAGRNIFYGLSLLHRFDMPKLKKCFAIFSLVDTNYAIMMSHTPYANKKIDQRFCLSLAFFIYLSWIIGTIVGALGAHHLPHIDGLEFILVLFFSLSVYEKYLKDHSFTPLIVALIALAIAYFSVPTNAILICAILISLAIFLIRYYLPGKKT